LDNVDNYVDVEKQEPHGLLKALVTRILESSSSVTLFLTSRAMMEVANAKFFSLPLSGLDRGSGGDLFCRRSGGVQLSVAELDKVMTLTNGHPLYLSMLAAQALSKQRSVASILEEVQAAKSEVPARILRSTYSLLKSEDQELLRLLAELEHPEHEDVLESLAGLRYNKLVKALKRLRDLNLVVERQDQSNKTLIDLHPLVRHFVRREFPKKDRYAFIARLLIFFDKKLALVTGVRKGPLAPSVLQVWIHKLEVLCNQENWPIAVSEFAKIYTQIEHAGYIEDAIRIGKKMFSGVDWTTAIDEIKEFRKVVNEVMHEMSHHGESSEVARWIDHYKACVGGRTADVLNALEIQAFDAWISRDYEKAIAFGKEAADTSEKVDILLPSDPRHTWALALRDGGFPEKALDIFLEGFSIDEALKTDKKDGAFFGNIGRTFQLLGRLDLAEKFLARSARALEGGRATVHNLGWIRMWVAELRAEAGAHEEAFTYLNAAIQILKQGSSVLVAEAEMRQAALMESYPRLGRTTMPDWKAEKLFNHWIDSVADR